VDTFFFLSGFLVCLTLLRQLDRNDGRFNPLLFYLHRYLRLTPALAAVILLQASLFRRVGDGPLWFTIEEAAEDCRANWWKNLLYIGNLRNYDEELTTSCIGQVIQYVSQQCVLYCKAATHQHIRLIL
jgi:peptidoglycan/LPS O-acetylase OafA/YrhL